VYHYFAGQHLHTQKRRAFLSSTTHITSTYQGIQKYGVFVCDACVKAMYKGRYLLGAAGWSATFLACSLAAVYVYATNTAGDQMWALIGIFGLFGGLAGLLGVIGVMNVLGIGAGVDDVIVNRLKKDPRRVKDQGDSFFTEIEYRHMFPDAPEAADALSAEQLLSLDAGRSEREDRPGRRRPKPAREEETKECPYCGKMIPAYAEACRYCKKILD
jgi:hypothetical protein